MDADSYRVIGITNHYGPEKFSVLTRKVFYLFPSITGVLSSYYLVNNSGLTNTGNPCGTGVPGVFVSHGECGPHRPFPARSVLPEHMDPEGDGHVQALQRFQAGLPLPGGLPEVGSHLEQVGDRLPVRETDHAVHLRHLQIGQPRIGGALLRVGVGPVVQDLL